MIYYAIDYIIFAIVFWFQAICGRTWWRLPASTWQDGRRYTALVQENKGEGPGDRWDEVE